MKKSTKKLNILRLLALLVICSTLFSLTTLAALAAEGGSFGDGTSWILEAGTLTINGSGEMPSYRDSNLPPWYESREQIVRIVVSDKITSIGSFAFYGCNNLVAVSIPNSVKTIGSYAFASCERLTSVQMGGSVSSIGNGAFYDCFSLESIRLPYGLTSIGSQAFYRCESLVSISVPADVRTMGDSVFAYCEKLVRAEIHARIKELPAWTFYGCSLLTEVHLAETISDIENNGFKKCEELSTVFFSGTEKQAEKIEEKISNDVSSFEVSGFVTNEKIPETTTSGIRVEKNENTSVQTDTVVVQNDNVSLNYTVERTYDTTTQKTNHTADVVVTIESKDSWKSAGDEVIKALNNITNTYSKISTSKSTTVTAYVKNNVQVSSGFLNRLAGRDVALTVILSNGSSWTLNCRDLEILAEAEDDDEGVGYSHTLKEAPAAAVEKLETDDCYRLVFDETVKQKAEVVVQLPTQSAVHTNAFLYQIEEDGTYKRLQGTAVDDEGRAHFYIASADKYSDYIIGLDVKGEDTSDVIIPDELMPSPSSTPGRLGSALERLENVQYVETGRVYSMGFGYGGLTWIIIGVLVGTTIVVGAIMTIWNKSRNAKMLKSKEQVAI